MAENKRTWLATILFLDIVKYSKESVADQIVFKDHFNKTVGEAIKQVPNRDRIILDTGDGCAICFLGDPEDAMFCAITIRDVYAFRDEQKDPAPYDVRMGINLGPVRVVKDLNARQNVIGDGINVGQRVMSFSGLNEIYVSRSFYEVIACLSSEYEDLFHDQGVRKDKHGREHAVYEIKQIQDQSLSVDESDILKTELLVDENNSVFEPVHQTGPITNPPTGWDPDILAEAISDLAPYMGVVAKAMVKKASRQCNNAEDLYKKLAESLASKEEQKAFLNKAPITIIEVPDITKGGNPVTDQPVLLHVWKKETLHDVEHNLAEVIGPLAHLLVKKAAAKTDSLEELCHNLAGEIKDDKSRRTFLHKSLA